MASTPKPLRKKRKKARRDFNRLVMEWVDRDCAVFKEPVKVPKT